MDAIASCVWWLLPYDLPPWQTVYDYWRHWRDENCWEAITAGLHEQERILQGRCTSPSAGVIDSQGMKGTERGGLHRCGGAKKVSRVKRHLLLDTLGPVPDIRVSPASVDDREAAVPLRTWARSGALRREVPRDG
ncbi:Putative transposase of IS4/5 family [Sinosporangium album]|uniref:Putative transposase of IS4/5 family n=1 Tax=Sinosporangium album TaxID=504805 RepID=A0A1G8LAN3_9ACTN|nr:transposase [Sinosporangium album]SDI52557.1 Putative transposase of IS4/5 family [Sinosporangium album]